MKPSFKSTGFVSTVFAVVSVCGLSQANADDEKAHDKGTPNIDCEHVRADLINTSETSEISGLRSVASAFLSSLTLEQTNLVAYCLGDSEMYSWTNVPGRRSGGIRLGDLSTEQRKLARTAVYSFLSAKGRMKADLISTDIEIASRAGPIEDYTVAVFGNPSTDGAWGMQFDGHHLVLNFLVHAEDVFLAPAFIGTQPLSVNGQTPLVEESRLGRELFALLSSSQRTAAMVPGLVRRDVMVGSGRGQEDQGRNFDYSSFEGIGIKINRLSNDQHVVLDSLVNEYVHNLRTPFADKISNEIKAKISTGYFVYSTSGRRVYYRVYLPEKFLIEYDDVANDHIHTVMRMLGEDATSDYGTFANGPTVSPELVLHYRDDPAHKAEFELSRLKPAHHKLYKNNR